MNKQILPLQTVEVNSTAILTADYAYDDYKLQLKFVNGDSYEYKSVPNHVFEGLRSSPSKGKFINRYILRSYSYSRV